MTLTLTIGGSPMPLPRGDGPYEMEYIPFGAARRALSGQYRVQHTSSRWRVKVLWEGLTQAERDTLWTAYGGAISTTVAVVLSNGLAFSAMTGLGSWQESHWHDWGGTIYYDVSFTLEQV